MCVPICIPWDIKRNLIIELQLQLQFKLFIVFFFSSDSWIIFILFILYIDIYLLISRYNTYTPHPNREFYFPKITTNQLLAPGLPDPSLFSPFFSSSIFPTSLYHFLCFIIKSLPISHSPFSLLLSQHKRFKNIKHPWTSKQKYPLIPYLSLLVNNFQLPLNYIPPIHLPSIYHPSIHAIQKIKPKPKPNSD